MSNMRFLNSRRVKEIHAALERQWGFEGRLDYVFLSDGEKINVINRAIADLDLERLRVNSVGLYFGELRAGELRLSIEGSQIIGKKAKKNVLEISAEDAGNWLRGEALEIKESLKGFMIVRSGKDFLGTGKAKEGKLLNYVPKARRVKEIA